jgi:hypothetical protein
MMNKMMAVAAFALTAGNAAHARPDMANYKVPTLEQMRAFVDGSIRNIPYSEYEVPPNTSVADWTWNIRRMDELQGQGDFKAVSLPWRIDVNLPTGVHFVHPAAVAKWLAGALGRAFDSKYSETQFFVYVHNGDADYEAHLVPDWDLQGWSVAVIESRYVN